MALLVQCARCLRPVGAYDSAVALDEGDEPAAGAPRFARLFHPSCWEEELRETDNRHAASG